MNPSRRADSRHGASTALVSGRRWMAAAAADCEARAGAGRGHETLIELTDPVAVAHRGRARAQRAQSGNPPLERLGIGIWAFVLALVATTRWEASETGHKADPAEIWRRFPKFVLGFVVASLLITFVTRDLTLAEYNGAAAPVLVAPLKDLRTWTFIFCFLSIGLTTRFKELVYAGIRPFAAFSIGVVVNVALGFILSTVLFASYWQSLTR